VNKNQIEKNKDEAFEGNKNNENLHVFDELHDFAIAVLKRYDNRMDITLIEPKQNQNAEVPEKNRMTGPDRVGLKRATMAPPNQQAAKIENKPVKQTQGKKVEI